MIFVVRPGVKLSHDDLAKLHDRLEAELNSDVGNKVLVIPEDCAYDAITDDGIEPKLIVEG